MQMTNAFHIFMVFGARQLSARQSAKIYESIFSPSQDTHSSVWNKSRHIKLYCDVHTECKVRPMYHRPYCLCRFVSLSLHGNFTSRTQVYSQPTCTHSSTHCTLHTLDSLQFLFFVFFFSIQHFQLVESTFCGRRWVFRFRRNKKNTYRTDWL